MFLLSFICIGFNQSSTYTNSKKKSETFGSLFGVSVQSKKTTLEPGQKAIYNVVIYKDFVYRIRLQANKKTDALYFLILDNKPTQTVLFDSSTLNSKNHQKVLHAENTRNLLIEVIYPQQNQIKNKELGINVIIEYYNENKLNN